jgi:meiotically up-regulated gene 157 (Mug157) protein
MEAEMTAKLPIALEAAIESAATLGAESQRLVRVPLERLWLDAAKPLPGGLTFLSTGDIPAMWIRDSTWQVRPLLRFAADPSVADFVESIIRTQAFYLGIDPYANAFNPAADGNCWHRDFPDQSPWVFERKFELDSITGFWQLSLDYDELARVAGTLDSAWWELTESLVELLWRETQHEPESYLLHRPNNPPHDSLSNGGRGADYQNCGLIWSAFRPSDDACELPFHVPSNIHAAVMLRRIADRTGAGRKALAESCIGLAQQIDAAVAKHGWVVVNGERVLAYEVDGMGGAVLMDDANYPNLL